MLRSRLSHPALALYVAAVLAAVSIAAGLALESSWAQQPGLDQRIYLPYLVQPADSDSTPTVTPLPLVDRCEANDSCRQAGTSGCTLVPGRPPYPHTTIFPGADEDWFLTAELPPGVYLLRMIPPQGQDYDLEIRTIVRQSTNDCPLSTPIGQGWTPGDGPEQISWLMNQPYRFAIRVYTPYPSVFGDAYRPYVLWLEQVGAAPSLTPTASPTSGEPGSTGTPLPTSTGTPTPPTSPEPVEPIVVDHESVDLFDVIPDEYIDAAALLRMVFVDRSVGVNIDEGLTCLSFPSNEDAPHNCSRIEHVGGEEYTVDPSVVAWSRPGGYDRFQWHYTTWWTSLECDNWDGKVGCFMQMIDPAAQRIDVASFQMSYLAVDENSSIMNEPGGFFHDNPNRADVYDLEDFEAAYPNTVFIYWTSNLARSIGTTVARGFNARMRQYATENSKPLFDVADNLSHDPDGRPCFDNRDGVPYDNGNKSENHADDGLNLPAICQHYTTEVEGGHLGSVTGGKIRVAKAFWVLMAQLAGWEPDAAP